MIYSVNFLKPDSNRANEREQTRMSRLPRRDWRRLKQVIHSVFGSGFSYQV